MEITRKLTLFLAPARSDLVIDSKIFVGTILQENYDTREIHTIQNIFRGKYLITFNYIEDLEQFKRNFYNHNKCIGGVEYDMEAADNIPYLQQQNLIKVLVFGAPSEMPDRNILQRLSYYGDIVKITHQTYKNAPHIRNGVRTLFFKKVRALIPLSLFVNGFRLGFKALSELNIEESSDEDEARNEERRDNIMKSNNNNNNYNNENSDNNEDNINNTNINNDTNNDNINRDENTQTQVKRVDLPPPPPPPSKAKSYSQAVKDSPDQTEQSNLDVTLPPPPSELLPEVPSELTGTSSDTYGEDEEDEDPSTRPKAPQAQHRRHASTPYEIEYSSFEEMDVSQISKNSNTKPKRVKKSKSKRQRETSSLLITKKPKNSSI